LIYDASKVAPLAKDFGLKDQMQRSSVSTMSNIAEGFERGGDQEFIQYLAMAKGSCGELRSQLYVALDQGYLSQTTFKGLYSNAEEINRMIAGFITYLQKSPLRGSKYKD
jgi:four helix bundle protein